MTNDLISRQYVIGLIRSMYPSSPILPSNRRKWAEKYEQFIRAEREISKLPSAQPERSLWFRIGEVCVGESKGDISAEMAVEKIRELLREAERREG